MLCALLLFVALASHNPLSALRSASSGGSTPSALAGPLAALAGAIVVAAGALAVHVLPRRGRAKEDERAPAKFEFSVLDRFAVAVIPLLLAGLLAFAIVEISRSSGPPRPRVLAPPPAAGGLQRPSRAGSQSGADHAGWVVAGAVAALALIVGGGALTLRMRGAALAPLARKARRAAEAREGLAVALSELESDPDPRRAVIRAYAGMESTLSGVRLGPRSWEAPREYLERALAELDVSGPSAARLTGLLERARFSRLAVGEELRGQAVAALRDVRDEVGGPA